MRKFKFFLSMLAIAGVLFATTSCVDDSESSSVTDLRDAKAAQLRAQATLAEAQAQLARDQGEAEKIAANAAKLAAEAEKVIADAQALLIAAQAAYENARRDYLAAQTETEQARAAQILAETEAASAKAAEELRKLQIANDLAVEENKAYLDSLLLEMALHKADLDAKLKIAQAGVSAEIAAELSRLVSAYSTEIGYLNYAKYNLAYYSNQLSQLKLDQALFAFDSARYVNSFIAGQNSIIKAATDNIARRQKTIDEYNGLEQKEDVVDAIKAKEAELAAVIASLEGLKKAIEPANAAQLAAWDELYDLYDKRSDFLSVTGGTYININRYTYLFYSSTTTGIDYLADGATYVHQGPLKVDDGIYYFSGWSTARERNLYSRYDNSWGDYNWYYLSYSVSGYSSLEDFEHKNEGALEGYEEAKLKAEEDIVNYRAEALPLQTKIKAAGETETAKIADRDVKYDAYIDAIVTYNDTLAAFDAKPVPQSVEDTARLKATIAALNAAKVAYDGVEYFSPYTVIDPNGAALGAASTAIERYAILNDSINIINSRINSAKSALSTAIYDIDEYNNILSILSYGPLAKLNKEIEDAQAKYAEKDAVWQAATNAYNTAVALTASIPLEINSLNVLEGLYTNYLGQTEYGTRPADYIKSEIERLQNEIKDYQLTIDEANQRLVNFIALSGVQYQIEYYKRTIQDVEREIDSYNKEIATRTVNVEYYEKAIAALLAIE